MTLTVSELAALLTEAVSRIGTWQERAEWLLPRLGENAATNAPICGALVGVRGFDGQCMRRPQHRGAHFDTRYDVMDREDDRGVLPREPSEAAIAAAQHAWWNHSATGDGLERVEVALRAAYAIDGVPTNPEPIGAVRRFVAGGISYSDGRSENQAGLIREMWELLRGVAGVPAVDGEKP